MKNESEGKRNVENIDEGLDHRRRHHTGLVCWERGKWESDIDRKREPLWGVIVERNERTNGRKMAPQSHEAPERNFFALENRPFFSHFNVGRIAKTLLRGNRAIEERAKYGK